MYADMVNVLKTVGSTALQVGESVGSIVGIRVGTEEPQHSSRRLTDRVEIRRYGPRIAAETTVVAGEEAARNTGFRRLAGYIFGGNTSQTTIAMTAPVAQQSEKIAMTAPVAQSTTPDGASVIRFFMPAMWSLETLPTPNDDAVRLVQVPAETYAVLRFNGDRGPKAVAAHIAELQAVLADNELSEQGPAVAWFYDPPWTLPFRRRNEVAIPVSS